MTDIDYTHQRTAKRIGYMILILWILSFLVSIAPMLGWKDPDWDSRLENYQCLVSQDISYQIFATASSFYVPLLVILFLYWRIFLTARKRIRRRQQVNKVQIKFIYLTFEMFGCELYFTFLFLYLLIIFARIYFRYIFYFPFVLILFDIVFNNWQSFFIFLFFLSFNLTICLLFFFSFPFKFFFVFILFLFYFYFFLWLQIVNILQRNRTKQKLVHYALNVLFSKKIVCLSSRCCCYSTVGKYFIFNLY